MNWLCAVISPVRYHEALAASLGILLTNLHRERVLRKNITFLFGSLRIRRG